MPLPDRDENLDAPEGHLASQPSGRDAAKSQAARAAIAI